jgi:hypothetical protein
MSDSMGKAVWQAASDGKKAELRQLIERGWSVNWHHPEVRRHMCLAWGRRRLCWFSRLRRRGSARPTRRRLPTAQAALAFCRRPAAPPSVAPASSSHGARRTLACSFVSPLWPLRMARVCVQGGFTALMMASTFGREGCVGLLLESGATVNATGVSLERPHPAHTVGQLPCSDFVRLLPFVFRTMEGQLCIARLSAATSRSPSAFSKAAPIRLSETITARRPSTRHGRGARARS